MDTCRCDICGFASFKSVQSYQGHLLTKKHLMRQKSTRQDLFQCKTCNKWYCGKSGISHHTKTCSSKTLNPNPIISEQEVNATPVSQQQIHEIKHVFEKELKEIKEAFKKEIGKLNTRLDKKENKSSEVATTLITPIVSTIRKKINKQVKQSILDKQKNTCGDCKLALTPYFELDHITGLQFGGTDDESNLMALCRECHAIKSIGENQCRKEIQDAIQTILREKRNNTEQQQV